jgi:hypothetical protein
MAGTPPVSADEPSNAVLAEQISNLEEKVDESKDQESAFHTRLEAKLEGMENTTRAAIDRLTNALVTLERSVALTKQKTETVEKASTERMDRHDKFHQDKEKEAADRKERSNTTGQLIVGALAALASIGGFAVALILH